MFFKSEVNKKCNNTDMFLSDKAIDFVQETKYLGVILNSQLKTSVDVSRQTRKFYAQANMLLRNFRYCSDDVQCMLFRSFCTNMYCCPLWFNSTSSGIKKLKASYNGVLRRLLLIVQCKAIQCQRNVCYAWYSIFFSSFFVTKKLPYVVTREVCPSVRPSSVEISLERGCTIINRPIDLKFGLSIGGGVMHV